MKDFADKEVIQAVTRHIHYTSTKADKPLYICMPWEVIVLAIVRERRFGGITVYVDDRDVAKTPEEQRRVDEEISNVLYNDIFANPANVEQLRQYNREHYGIED